MAKPFGRTLVGRDTLPRAGGEEKQYVIEARVNGGMITSIDAADIPSSALQDAKNVRVRLDKTITREGSTLLTPTKPDSDSVLLVYSYRTNDGSSFTLRFTKDNVHQRSSSWVGLTGTLTGAVTDRFQAVTAFNQCVFTNGVDPIQVVNSTASNHTQLGNAPIYKYITSFYNRVIGFNFVHATTPDPVQIGWSADGVITEWDPLNDFSAGSSPLIESPGDFSDFGTGVFGFTNVMVILREKSVWLATKQPSASFPFNFFAAVPGKGCTAPYSAAVVPGGLVWVDPRTQRVYAYSPSGQPESIGEQIEKSLFSSIQNPDDVFASYNTRNDEYTVALPFVGSTALRLWTFNFRTKAWSYDEREGLTCLNDIDSLASSVYVEDLPGYVENLSGYIEDLSGIEDSATTRVFGFNNGNVEVEDAGTLKDNGVSFESSITSKDFYWPVVTTSFVKLKFEFNILTPVTITLQYSRDLGETWINAKAVTYSDVGQNILVYQKLIRSRKLTFRIFSTDGMWELIDYEIHGVGSGETVTNI